MRPTSRGWLLAGLALVLWLFANQTQVGWLYVFSAIAAGLWLLGLFIPRAMLGRLRFARRVNGSWLGADLELYTGQPLQVEIEVTQPAHWPALQVRGSQACPWAPAPERSQAYFVPAIPARGQVVVAFASLAARRGWFPLEAAPVSTRAPFGLFAARRLVLPDGPPGLLVFPEYRKLGDLSLFDRQPLPERSQDMAGIGAEFIGVRDFRPGDPRRHVHWRSTARAGRLIVKEFAEERQPGLLLALDLRAGSALGGPDDTSLELAIKLAASLAHAAQQRGWPVRLAANNPRWPAPAGNLSWWALMNYLAHVEAGGSESFAGCLADVGGASLLAAIFSAPDVDAAAQLAGLQRTGQQVLAVLIDPAPFVADGAAASQFQSMAASLSAAGVEVRLVGAEADWERSLQAGLPPTSALPGGSPVATPYPAATFV